MDRSFRGIWIPAEIWLDQNLTVNEKVLLAEIDSLSKIDGCYASNQYFGDFLGLSKERARKIVASLKDKGYIEITLIYKENSNEVDKRIIKNIAYGQKQPQGQKQPMGMVKNDHEITYNNNINNINNTSKQKQSPKNDKQLEEIEKLWALYPNKKGKARAIKDIKKHMKNYTYEQLENAVKTYAAEVANRDKQYIKHGSTFFKEDILDYLEAEEPEEPKTSDGAVKDEKYFMKLMEEQLKGSKKLG